MEVGRLVNIRNIPFQAELSMFEFAFFQRCGHVVGVFDRISQRGVYVGTVSDHQGDAVAVAGGRQGPAQSYQQGDWREFVKRL